MGILNDTVRVAEMASRASQRGAGNPEPPAGPTLAERAAEARAEKAARQGPPRLDEAARFISRYVVATPAQIDAMVLLAAQTWVSDVLVCMPRALFTSNRPASGKTNAMMVTASLCFAPHDTTGSSYSLTSKLAGNGSEGIAAPTLYRDEISSIFGNAGTRGGNNPLADIIRKGYKKNAKSSWSVDRTPVEFSIFSTILMTGLQTAVPSDIRTRCVVFHMQAGAPTAYFDARDAETQAGELAKSFGAWVKAYRTEIASFRGRGIHPKLEGRKLEIWEGMFAVAAAAGQDWLNRAMTAFCELALDESDQPILSPEQQVLRDLAAIAEASDQRFIGGNDLADDLARVDSPLYEGRTTHAIACLIRDAVPFPSRQVNRVRGYYRDSLLDAWAQIRPPDALDTLIPEEEDPFAPVEEDDPDEGVDAEILDTD
jgi:hypothetical protein